MATDHDKPERPINKPQSADADKALLEAEPDWERMGQAAKRLLGAKQVGSDVKASKKRIT